MKEHAGQPGQAHDYKDITGTTTFRVRMIDKEGMNNSVSLRVGADYTMNEWGRGRLNEHKALMRKTEIRIVIGPRDNSLR